MQAHFFHAIVVFVAEQRAFGPARMPHQAQARMAEEHGFGRQHARDPVRTMDAAGLSRHVGYAHSTAFQTLCNGLIEDFHGHLFCRVVLLGLTRQNR
jgi:hypothetical protein